MSTPRMTISLCNEEPRREGGTWYAHFCQHVFTLRMYNKEAKPLVAEIVEDPNGDYCGWWDNEAGEFHHIYPSPQLTEMCFPYGSKVEEDRGRGHKLPVRVTILREASPDDLDLCSNRMFRV